MKLKGIILLCVFAAVLGGLIVFAVMPAGGDQKQILKERKLYEARIKVLEQKLQSTEATDLKLTRRVSDLRDSLKASRALTKQVQTKLRNAQKIDLSHASAPDLDSLVRVVRERAEAGYDQ